MPDHIDQPCKNGLTAACFLQEPEFARRAFAFRLLAAFIPPALSRKLLIFLGLLRFDPAGNLPVGFDLPPWWFTIPGTVIPSGWKWGDPPFNGLFLPPVFPPFDDPEYIRPPPDDDFIPPVEPPFDPGFYIYPIAPWYLLLDGLLYSPRFDFSSPPDNWVIHSDDSKWEDDITYIRRSYWNEPGQYWHGDIVGFRIKAITTWTPSFQPTKIRFELLEVSTCAFYLQSGSGDVTLVYESDYESLQEIDITYPNPETDIQTLLVLGTGARIKNISFYVP